MKIVATSTEQPNNNFLHSGYVSALATGVVDSKDFVVGVGSTAALIFFTSTYFILKKKIKAHPVFDKIYIGFLIALVVFLVLLKLDFVNFESKTDSIPRTFGGSYSTEGLWYDFL